MHASAFCPDRIGVGNGAEECPETGEQIHVGDHAGMPTGAFGLPLKPN